MTAVKKPATGTKEPADTADAESSFFDLSFSGHLPQLLRAIADQIDAGRRIC